ncbi:hypothetical protein ACVW1C_000120 [Bradyrhizobium sp. USDA 4011]
MGGTMTGKAKTARKPASRAFASADTSLRISAAEFVAWQEAIVSRCVV